jgi:hypothetical protein
MFIGSILLSFGIFYGRLVNFVVIWCTFSPFGLFIQEKSGNPGCRLNVHTYLSKTTAEEAPSFLVGRQTKTCLLSWTDLLLLNIHSCLHIVFFKSFISLKYILYCVIFFSYFTQTGYFLLHRAWAIFCTFTLSALLITLIGLSASLL